jgi:hypothetical protein
MQVWFRRVSGIPDAADDLARANAFTGPDAYTSFHEVCKIDRRVIAFYDDTIPRLMLGIAIGRRII